MFNFALGYNFPFIASLLPTKPIYLDSEYHPIINMFGLNALLASYVCHGSNFGPLLKKTTF